MVSPCSSSMPSAPSIVMSPLLCSTRSSEMYCCRMRTTASAAPAGSSTVALWKSSSYTTPVSASASMGVPISLVEKRVSVAPAQVSTRSV
jgi:hypothetical protein